MLRVLLDDDNDFPPGGPRLVDGVDSVASALRAELSVQAGEWPYDKTFGVDWRNEILQKFFAPAASSALLATTINGLVPEIEPVSGAQIEIDTASQADARQVTITVSDVVVDDDRVDLTFVSLI